MKYERITEFEYGRLIETVEIDESSISISQRAEPGGYKKQVEEDDYEVTHKVFFG